MTEDLRYLQRVLLSGDDGIRTRDLRRDRATSTPLLHTPVGVHQVEGEERDSNPQPPGSQPGALTIELPSP